MNIKPLFIVIEGGEGAGKTTLRDAIKKVLGDSVVITREPGGSPYAEAIREVMLGHNLAKTADAKTMLCLMFAARFDHVRNTIVPALDQGKHVICDRFDGSSFAYQLYGQKNPEAKKLFWNLRSNVDRLPDLYIYADVDVEEGLRRVHSRNKISGKGNHFDDRGIDFHQRLRTGFKAFLKKVPHITIDANQAREKVVEDFLREFKAFQAK